MLDLTGRGCSQIRDDEAQKSVARQDARQLMIFIWRDLLPMSSLTVPSSGGGKQLKQRCNAFLLYLSCEAVVRLRAPEAAAIDLAHDRPATHPRLLALDLRMCVSLCQQPCHLCTAHVVVLQRLGLRDLQDGLPPPGSDVTFSRLYCLLFEHRVERYVRVEPAAKVLVEPGDCQQHTHNLWQAKEDRHEQGRAEARSGSRRGQYGRTFKWR